MRLFHFLIAHPAIEVVGYRQRFRLAKRRLMDFDAVVLQEGLHLVLGDLAALELEPVTETGRGQFLVFDSAVLRTRVQPPAELIGIDRSVLRERGFLGDGLMKRGVEARRLAEQGRCLRYFLRRQQVTLPLGHCLVGRPVRSRQLEVFAGLVGFRLGLRGATRFSIGLARLFLFR